MQHQRAKSQQTTQRTCNMDLKTLATKRLNKLNRATVNATNVQQHATWLATLRGSIDSTKDTEILHQKSDLKRVATAMQQPCNGHATWTNEEKFFIQWFQEQKYLPNEPFQLKQGVKVLNPGKFYESLRLDISEGSKCPRNLHGALLNDLKCLEKITEEK